MDNFSKKEFLFLEELIKSKNQNQIKIFTEQKSYQDLHNLLSYLSNEQRINFFRILPLKLAASILEGMPDKQEICRVLNKTELARAASLLKNFASDNQVDILKILPFSSSQKILQLLPKKNRKDIVSAISYADDTAGGLMITEFLKYNISLTANDIKKDLEKHSEQYKDFDVQYTYTVDKKDRLVGIIPIRNLLLASGKTALSNIIRKEIISISVDKKVEEIKHYFEKYNFIAFPVLDQEGKLLGIITRGAMEHFLQKEAAQEVLKLTGIMGGEEYRSQPIYQRSVKRLSWLSINIVLNFMAASVIIAYEGTLAQVITLAVFLPIISDMSGCSGNQSVAVTLREISLGLISHKEILKVLLKELVLGCINGIILGSILALIAIFWKGNIYLGLVVGLALAINTVMAVCLGSAIPIVLKFFKMDPAIASSPILTTVTDMSGFFLIFLLASQVLPYIS
jgi:magnesium transporter